MLERFKEHLSLSKYHERLKNSSNQPESNLWSTSDIGRFANANRFYFHYHNAPMPETEQIYPWTSYIYGIYYYLKYFTDSTLTKFATTKLANKILNQMNYMMVKELPENEARLRYLGLSGHEFNLFPFMLGYGLTSKSCIERNLSEKNPDSFDPNCFGSPDASSNMIWELSRKKNPQAISQTDVTDESQYFIRVLYNG